MNNQRSGAEIRRVLSKTPILMYHKIDARREIGINALPPARFREHVQFLHAEGYETITFPDLLHRPSLPAKPLMITFDDGYRSIYEHARPAMAGAGFRGVVFVVSGYIGRRNEWDISLNGRRYEHLSADEIRRLSTAGWEIGAHSVSHRALPLLSAATVRKELQNSRKTLADITGQPPVSFAYPFGMLRRRDCDLVSEAGYSFACKGIRGAQSSDFFQLTRIPVYQFESARHLRQKLAQPLAFLNRLKLKALGIPVYAVPLYQIFTRPQLKLDQNLP